MRACSASTRAAAARSTGVAAVWTLDDLPELATASVPPARAGAARAAPRHPLLAGERACGTSARPWPSWSRDDPVRGRPTALERVVVALRAAAGRRDARPPRWPPRPAPRASTRTGRTTWSRRDHERQGQCRGGAGRCPRRRRGPPRAIRAWRACRIETRGVLASRRSRSTAALTVWTSTQVPFAVRSGIAGGARPARGARSG